MNKGTAIEVGTFLVRSCISFGQDIDLKFLNLNSVLKKVNIIIIFKN